MEKKGLAVTFRNMDTDKYEGQGYLMPDIDTFKKYALDLGCIKIAENKYKHPSRNSYICLEESVFKI